MRGFAGDEFDLAVIPGPPSQFSWVQPHGATSVTCGLFVATPDVFGESRGHIRNDSQALYRTHRFQLDDADRAARQVTFRLADLRTAHEPRACEADLRLQPAAAAPAYPILSTLRVGCWASDTSGVIAATQLQDVSLSDVPETSLPVTVCAGAEQNLEGRYCYPRATTGVCKRGVCEQLPAPAVPAGTEASSTGGSSAQSPSEKAAAGQSSNDEGGSSGQAAREQSGDGGEPALSAAPTESCENQPDDVLCRRDRDFKFGRCIAGFCNPTPGQSSTLDLPLLVSSCAPQADDSADTNWLNCFDVDMQGFGTCLGGRCRTRCLDENDCTDEAGKICVGQVAMTHELACFSRQGPTALGVCVTATEMMKLCASE